MMVGKVTLVSSFPATAKGMLRVLKNQQLVNELAGGGAPYEIHAELSVDPSTPSQYRWTSSEGPPTRVESGTVATAFISTKTQRPIEKVLPMLRKWTGAS
jgi:HlyD family secretion protein